MAHVTLKEEQDLSDPAKDKQSFQVDEDNCSVFQFKKEEPEEVEIKTELLDFPLFHVCVKSEDEQPESSHLYQAVKEENREDTEEAGAKNHPKGNMKECSNLNIEWSWEINPSTKTSAGTKRQMEDHAKGSRTVRRSTPQTHTHVTEQLQGQAHRNHGCESDAGSLAKRRSYGTITKLQDHERTHTGKKPFKCSVCEKSFVVKHDLNRHMRTHTGEKPFKCTVCEKCFSQSNSLYKHMSSGLHTGPFKCSVCSDVFSRNCNLQQHMKIHSREKLL